MFILSILYKRGNYMTNTIENRIKELDNLIRDAKISVSVYKHEQKLLKNMIQ